MGGAAPIDLGAYLLDALLNRRAFIGPEFFRYRLHQDGSAGLLLWRRLTPILNWPPCNPLAIDRTPLRNLMDIGDDLGARGVQLVVLDQGIDTSTPVGQMFFNILGAVAEFEHSLMVERTKQGLEAARARGRTGGQKPKLKARQIRLAQEMYDEIGSDGKRKYTVQQIAEEFGVSRPTIYRHLERA